MLLPVPGLAALQEMTDQSLSNVTGQAIMLMDKEAANGFTFYKAGLDAMLEINMNIEKLQLGCGGINDLTSPGSCDIDIDRLSLGCVANGSGQCVSLDPVGNQIAGAIDDIDANKTKLRDFALTRPYFQFAIKNDDSRTLREVVGIRLGAENSSGPLSFASLNSFSGYLTGTANLEMIGAQDVAATCKYPATCIAPGANTSDMLNNGASSWGSPSTSCGFLCTRGNKGPPAGGYLNLGDDMILDIGLAHIRYQEALVGYGTVTRNGNSVTLSGNRQTQASIAGLQLGGVVNSLVYGNTDGSTNVGANPLTLNDSDAGGLVGALGPTLLPLLRGGVGDQIKRQLAQGLRIYDPDAATNQSIINGTSDGGIHTDLNNYSLPYNLSNVHQLEVASDVFGLSFQKEAVQYPGYDAAVLKGWAMYIPSAFTLNISQPTTALVSAITGSSDARDGNIVGLEPVYRNCWGAARFC